MFKELKSSGFNIEGSHVKDRDRMSNLFSIIMIAYVWCYLVGIYIHENVRFYKDFGSWPEGYQPVQVWPGLHPAMPFVPY